MTSRRSQRETKPDKFDAAALESELHSKRPTRQDQRADARRERYLDAGAAVEAQSLASVSGAGRRFRGRPTAGGAS